MSPALRKFPNRTFGMGHRSSLRVLGEAAFCGLTMLLGAACGGASAAHGHVDEVPDSPAPESRSVVQLPKGERGGRPAAYAIPFLYTPFRRVYAPSGGRYLNDHSIVRDDDGVFHVIGITGASEGRPFEENAFLHATADDLEGTWHDNADALLADATLDGCCIWAPFITRASDDRWLMYYAAANGQHVLRRAESDDLQTWRRSPGWSDDDGRAPGGRDPFVLSEGGTRYLYSVGVSDAHGQILVSQADAIDEESPWSPAHPVITDPEASVGWGNLESPFVVVYDGLYYLFLTHTLEASSRAYYATWVFVSPTPTHWVWDPIAELPAHAAEIVHEGERWHISSAGWTSETGEAFRGLSIAHMAWAHVADAP